MCGDRGEAEDLVQDCLLQLARRWPRVRSMDHQDAYARRVLFNLVLDSGRKRTRRQQELEASETPVSPDGDRAGAGALEARADLMEALATLPARQRAVLVLRYFGDLPEAEVATILDCPLGTIKSNTARGLERLREALDPAAPLPMPDDTSRR